MGAKVRLEITAGALKGKAFVFEEHDTFLLGRAPECHISLPDDSFVSRHHFLLELNPPQVCLRDLGSLNGTFVNGVRIGGGRLERSPLEESSDKAYEVALHDGDVIQVGETVIGVAIEQTPDKTAVLCCAFCGGRLGTGIASLPDGTPVCEACAAKQQAGLSGETETMAAETLPPGGKALPTVPGYVLERQVGSGGMGVVYKGRRIDDETPFAIKIVHARAAVAEQAQRTFMREMEILRDLQHPNIVAFRESRSEQGAFCFVMEYCRRGSVADLMDKRGGKLPVDLAVHIALQALKGLAHAHEQNLVHRDMKPQNLLLDGTRTKWVTKVGDFGLAKNLDKAGISGLTATGTFGGSCDFMPREQVTNFKYVQPSADVWSMAATLYAMITGKFPRLREAGQDPIEIILRGEAAPIRVRDPKVPSGLAQVIDQALVSRPEDRFPTAREFREALRKAF